MDRRRDQRERGARRCGVLLLALFQFATVALAPAADVVSRSGTRADTPGSAPEAPGGEECGAHHDHVTCHFCRILNQAVAWSSPGVLAPLASPPWFGVGASNPEAPSRSATAFAGLGARAPPVA